MPDAQAKPVFMGGLMRLEEMNLFGEEPVAQTVKNLPAVWETRVQTLDREDPLEEEMATHSNILAWRILWTEEPGRLLSLGLQRARHD